MTTLVLPMLGLGSRFAKEGYSLPKYLLPLCGRPILYWTLYSFRKCFDWHLVFVVRRDHIRYCIKDLIIDFCREIGLKSFEILVLDFETTGQAHTFYQALVNTSDSDPVCCFNIDSIHLDFDYPFYQGFEHPVIETFKGPGDHWSFVKTSNDYPARAIKTAEKLRISDNCSNGFYYFSSKIQFTQFFDSSVLPGVGQEHYICPLYNGLIESDVFVVNKEVSRSVLLFSGIPEEYRALRHRFRTPDELYSLFA